MKVSHNRTAQKSDSSGRSRRQEEERGRRADRPRQIPKAGWRDILLRTKQQIGSDNIGIVAAGVAFYAFLAVFPALVAAIMIYGLVVNPETVTEQLQALTTILPQQARGLIEQQLGTIAGQATQTLGWGVAISIFLALWSANKGMKALFKGVNIAYDEDDDRGFIKQNALTLLFTVGGIVVVIISALLVVALPVILGNLGLPSWGETLARWGRWLLLALLILGSLALIYRYAPAREHPRWRWVSWGSVAAVVLWIIGSWAFSFYVDNFGSYNTTYGSAAAVVILMLWFMLTSFAILLGAEINSEMEGQTRKDSTTGPDRPMGERGASHADRLGKSP